VRGQVSFHPVDQLRNMAAFIQFFITYSLAMMAFWILEITTIVFIVYSFEYFLGGRMFPIHIMPGRCASGTEMGTVLLRTVLSGRDFSRAVERRRALASTRDPNRIAFSHLVNRARDVASRIAPLSGGGRIENLFFEFAMIFFRDRAPLVLR
jgi:hypothetical protein